MNTFWTWLVGEAGAAWIVGVAGIVLATVGVVLTIRASRPDRIIVAELGRSSLLEVHTGFRERICSTFDGVRVASLAQLEICVQNTGHRCIQLPEIMVQVPNAELLAVDVVGQFGEAHASVRCEQHKAVVVLPFLNAKRHEHYVLLRLIVDGPLNEIRISGVGQGWSARTGVLPLGRARLAELGLGAVAGVLIGSLAGVSVNALLCSAGQSSLRLLYLVGIVVPIAASGWAVSLTRMVRRTVSSSARQRVRDLATGG